MVRVTTVLLVLLCVGTDPAHAQIFGRGNVDRGEPVFTPLRNFRERAPTSIPAVLAEKVKAKADGCKLKDKLAPGAACKRCQAEKMREEEKAKEEAAKEAELKKLEAEAEKAELEAKKLKEEDEERNKPWDIADKDNAELGDLLAAAQAAKKEQDLAPKKQQALDYLAGIGCNKDPNVTKAIMAGLQDYNTEVRKTAVQAVIFAMAGPNGLQYPVDPQVMASFEMDPYAVSMVGGCCDAQCSTCPKSCRNGCNANAVRRKCLPPVEPKDEDCPACDLAKQKELAKQNRKKQREMRKAGHRSGCQECTGCQDGCNAYISCGSGFPEVPCEPCQERSDGCKSCCDEMIRKELRKMAFDPDPKRANCYYEPSIEVRNLALQAYSLCPDMEEKEEEDPDVEPNQGSSESQAGTEEGGTSEGNADELDPPLPEESPSEDTEAEVEEEAGEKIEGLLQTDQSFEIKLSQERMLRGRVSRFLEGGYEITYSTQFQIPSGNRVYVTGNGGNGHVAEVLSSSPGKATVKVIQGRFASRSSTVQIGVMR